MVPVHYQQPTDFYVFSNEMENIEQQEMCPNMHFKIGIKLAPILTNTLGQHFIYI